MSSFLDALDECQESDRRVLFRRLKDQLQKRTEGSGKIKYLLTSRPYDHVTFEFQELVEFFPYIRIPGEEESERISQEINCVIEYRVQRVAKEQKLNDTIKNYLRQRLLRIPHRTYLWVSLVFDDLGQGFKKTERGIDAVIKALPETVDQAYEKILSRSKDEHKVRQTLSIILAAARPLTLREMNVAVNIESSPRSMCEEDLDLEEEEYFKDNLRSWCGLFVSIYDGKVYFLHQTAREFLIPRLSPPASTSLHWRGSIGLEQAHSLLAEICTIYLEFRDFEDEVPSGPINKEYLTEHVFLQYSASNWVAHLRLACIEDREDLIPALQKLCDPDTKRYGLWIQIYFRAIYRRNSNDPRKFTALMAASYFGFVKVIKLLLDRGVDINTQNNGGGTALHIAAREGHQAVVKILLEKGADAKIQTKIEGDGGTALHRAAREGHEAVVQMLLEKEIDVNVQNSRGRTALHLAVIRGHKAVLEMLLNKKADANIQDENGETALHSTLRFGYVATAKILLEKGADVNIANEDGDTPLHWAVRGGNEDAGKMLLENGADVYIAEKSGGTALYWAVMNEHVAITKMLLEKETDVNIPDQTRWTLLHLAVISRNEVFVKMLLERDDIEADSKDNVGRTPLSWAASGENESILRMLMERDDVDVNSKDNKGRTPLSWAAKEGNEAMVRLLVERNDVDVESEDNEGRTPLWLADKYGHGAMRRILLREELQTTLQQPVEQMEQGGVDI